MPLPDEFLLSVQCFQRLLFQLSNVCFGCKMVLDRSVIQPLRFDFPLRFVVFLGTNLSAAETQPRRSRDSNPVGCLKVFFQSYRPAQDVYLIWLLAGNSRAECS